MYYSLLIACHNPQGKLVLRFGGNKIISRLDAVQGMMGGTKVAEPRLNRQMSFFKFGSGDIEKIRILLTGIRPAASHHSLLVGQRTVINSCT